MDFLLQKCRRNIDTSVELIMKPIEISQIFSICPMRSGLTMFDTSRQAASCRSDSSDTNGATHHRFVVGT